MQRVIEDLSIEQMTTRGFDQSEDASGARLSLVWFPAHFASHTNRACEPNSFGSHCFVLIGRLNAKKGAADRAVTDHGDLTVKTRNRWT